MELKPKTFLKDSITGFNIFLVSLPLCIAICVICKLSLSYVIFSSVIGAIFSSPNNVAGPALRFSPAIVFCVFELGSYGNFLTALFFVGLIQMIIGMVRAIPINTLLPNAVVKSILVSFGLLLIINYLPLILGYTIEDLFSHEFRNAGRIERMHRLSFMFTHPDNIATVTGIAFFLLLTGIYSFKKMFSFNRYIPLLFLLVSVFVIVYLLINDSVSSDLKPTLLQNSQLASNLRLDHFLSLDFSITSKFKFWLFVVLITLFLSVETLFSVETMNYLGRDMKLDINKSLAKQGFGNILCSMLGVIPITSRVLSSSIQLNAGVTTNRSVIINSLFLVLSLVFFNSFVNFVPLPIFAAAILYFSFGLLAKHDYKYIYRYKYEILLPFLSILICFIFLGLQTAMIAGFLMSLVIIIYNFKKAVFSIEKGNVDGRIIHKMILPPQIHFFSKGFIHDYLFSVKSGSKIVIDRSKNKNTHVDVEEVIDNFVDHSREKNIQVEIVD